MSTVLKTKRQRIAWVLIVVVVTNLFAPATSYALTSGPTQPEVQSFQPAGTTDMVDLFSGDFSYNIPLFELPGPNGGYPFNLSYQAGITMEQEASWVGLGWSLNPGAINRQMRGLPDDFNGDEITTKIEIDPAITVGVGAGGGFELFGASDKQELGNLGLSIFYNNYKGFGYSIDASAGFPVGVRSGMTSASHIGASLSLNSQEGASINPSLSIGSKLGEFGLRAGYNSQTGLQDLSFTHTKEINVKGYTNAKKVNADTWKANSGSSASLTLASPGYVPQVSMPMQNYSVSARVSVGGAGWGAYGKAYVKGFYSEQKLKNNSLNIASKAYGYLNYDAGALDPSAILDFNREKDGIVSKESPNLGIPSLTYDIYSVTGQGIGAMYRPIRNDIGILRDAETTSESTGFGLGVDGAPALSKVGINLNVNLSKSTSGAWKDGNEMYDQSHFLPRTENDEFEPWNFKVHGELTSQKTSILDKIGGSNAVRVQIEESDGEFVATNFLEDVNTEWDTVLSTGPLDKTRKQRNEVIQTFTKGQVLKSNGKEILPYFIDSVATSPTVKAPYQRTYDKLSHIAGFEATTPDGLRYNYTIPVYNITQEEVLFSTADVADVNSRVGITISNSEIRHDSGEKLLKRTILPKYAHAYLLTSIMGADYVDVTNNGVTADDLGYWVKFTYRRTADQASPYKWREPFSKANFVEGWKTDARDDKGTYTYGEKEMWYLQQAETKSHVAFFDISARKDAFGVDDKNQIANNKGKASYQLDSIRLYSRSAIGQFPINVLQDYPMKTIRLGYSDNDSHGNDLCVGAFNADSGRGKLTLKSLQFDYGRGDRGKFNPYIFTYDQDLNFSYNPNAYDRWGIYKPTSVSDNRKNIDFPYTDQDPNNKDDIDNNAAAWSLTQIKTPSGSTITVNYETDDYAYVQHKQAMQMVEIVNPNGPPESATSDPFDLSSLTKVRFKLEEKITPGSDNNETSEQRQIVLKYLDVDRGQLFFKALLNLRSSSEDISREFISGYADIDMNGEMKLEKGSGTDYEYGSFYLAQESYKDGGSSVVVHPFSKRAWQHIRTNQPELARSDWQVTMANTDADVIGQIRALASPTIFDDVRQMLEGFYHYCDQTKNWGKEISPSKSWIRLKSVDKIKYGGGLRVKQITLNDNWKKDKDGVYGQVYDYTILEDNDTISSGVASYEPLIGGEENPLRYAKTFNQSVPLRSDNNLFFEFPVNESYYPGPQVGYRKVTVTSLAAAALENVKDLDNVTFRKEGETEETNIFPKAEGTTWGTTGKSVHEFYTARDFPVISDETDKFDASFRMSIPVPFLGNVSISKLASTQGYSIITNDMHGKPRQLSTFRQKPDGSWEDDPISWVKYNYVSKPKAYQNEIVQELSSEFVLNLDNTTLSLPDKTDNQDGDMYSMGQENEFFLDMRQYEDNAWEGGASGNLDIIFLPIFAPIPFPTVWPSIGKANTQLRTAVANKIIFRPGILQNTQAYDGGSIVKKESLRWDKLTGQVVLETVTNNFDQPIYSYTIPAHTKYRGLSGAYQNIGLTLKIRKFVPIPNRPNDYYFTADVRSSTLFPGDEMIVFQNNAAVARVIYMGDRGGTKQASSIDASGGSLPTGECTAIIVRSGFRNQLNASAGSITALSNPIKPVPDSQVSYPKTVTPLSNK